MPEGGQDSETRNTRHDCAGNPEGALRVVVGKITRKGEEESKTIGGRTMQLFFPSCYGLFLLRVSMITKLGYTNSMVFTNAKGVLIRLEWNPCDIPRKKHKPGHPLKPIR